MRECDFFVALDPLVPARKSASGSSSFFFTPGDVKPRASGSADDGFALELKVRRGLPAGAPPSPSEELLPAFGEDRPFVALSATDAGDFLIPGEDVAACGAALAGVVAAFSATPADDAGSPPPATAPSASSTIPAALEAVVAAPFFAPALAPFCMKSTTFAAQAFTPDFSAVSMTQVSGRSCSATLAVVPFTQIAALMLAATAPHCATPFTAEVLPKVQMSICDKDSGGAGASPRGCVEYT
mmetsp:Transcript_28683/g.72638  ORF Transcript_28683/g.72638 Transcript_28683/m.72638 type:complete len:241 (-) Transcript_28683:621-1343(-)